MRTDQDDTLNDQFLLENPDLQGIVKVVDIAKAFNDRLEEVKMLPRNRDGIVRGYGSRRVISYLESLRFERSTKAAQGYAHINIKPNILQENAFIYDIIQSEDSEDIFDKKEITGTSLRLPRETSLSSQTSPNDQVSERWKKFIIEVVRETSEEGINREELWEKTRKLIGLGVGYHNRLDNLIEELVQEGLIFESKSDYDNCKKL